MPELPEVETYARALALVLVGCQLTGGRLLWPKTLAEPRLTQLEAKERDERLTRAVGGHSITRVWRRAKYLVFELEGGPQSLLIHLRMTGRLELVGVSDEDPPHLSLALALDDERELRFIDYRKFGRVWLVSNFNVVLNHLGPEPLAEDFTAQTLASMLKGRRGRLKPLLLDQRFIAGLGNIYVDEALFRARLHPLTRADMVGPERARALHRALRSVLREAIRRGGTTFQSFVGPEGEPGGYRERLRVFGRQGRKCWRRGCPGVVEKTMVGQRGTHLCPLCQTNAL